MSVILTHGILELLASFCLLDPCSMAGCANGTITFLFTDIEGSTRLWEDYPDAMRLSLEKHDLLIRRTIDEHGGRIFKAGGDGFCVAFRFAHDAMAAALETQLALHSSTWDGLPGLRSRMAIHSGIAQERDGDYFGSALNCVARILESGSGGQILVSLATAEIVREQLPNSANLIDLGLHRLRDLQRPERVYQLVNSELPADFPPLRSQGAFQHNIPQQLTSFVGRERELAEAQTILLKSRLLTLTGAGGSGKTRLSLQLGLAALARYRDGVWLVDLAGLTDPSMIAQAVASAVGIREESGVSLLETITEHLRTRTTLVILDNCEHLLDGAASLANHLLKLCPQLKIVATSRQSLGVPGETSSAVPPLAAPDPSLVPPGRCDVGKLQEFDSVRLFMDRATAALPTFRLTPENGHALADICHRLDGIPLAIELAAARVKVLTVQQIASRLDDRFRLLAGGNRSALPRQQALRALIDWSYDLLSDHEKRMFCLLSVFTGGCTLEASEWIWEDPEAEAMDVLSQLVDKSLILMEEGIAGQPRYRLSETMREYGRDRLASAGTLRRAEEQHGAWFLSFVETAEPKLQGPQQDLWLDRLEWERDNLRAAIERSTEPESALRLCGALWRFWYVRGYYSEGRTLIESALFKAAATAEEIQREIVAKALKGAGNLAWFQGDLESAGRYHEESLDIYRLATAPHGVAGALNNLANLARDQDHLDKARDLFQQSLEIYQELGDRAGIAMALTNLGGIALQLNDLPEAKRLTSESLKIHRQRGDLYAASVTLHNLGELSTALRMFDEAQSLFCESLDLKSKIGDKSTVALSLATIGNVSAHLGDYERAAALLAASAAAREQMDAPMTCVDREEYNGFLDNVKANMTQEAFAITWDRGYKMPIDTAIQFALVQASLDTRRHLCCNRREVGEPPQPETRRVTRSAASPKQEVNK